MSKKLSEYKNEEATKILADILEPASEIFSDKEFTENLQKSPVSAAGTALRKHGKAVVDILAIYDGISRQNYSVNPMEILSKFIKIMHDNELMSAFTFQEQTAEN